LWTDTKYPLCRDISYPCSGSVYCIVFIVLLDWRHHCNILSSIIVVFNRPQ
ncbi:hypothetical protein KI387_036603, partial [Taxus chinensis]